jgi:DNA invertase Pin-like site-specific DNA recombinase
MAKRLVRPDLQQARGSRCAVYTRKSTEEGLEQEFNRLDAQYEACAAYVASQRHEGWTLCRDRYDDGGFSGGNTERPSLKRLLADIEAGKINIIVVYKVDRLTRSLADFAKIVEVLDARGASFVSITQAFNTTTSMGRLTLNVLLSFAQFEREVTGERIRDEIAASKAKGMWMGGPVPLGYRVENRKLVVDDGDAAVVRHIFQRYAAFGSGQKLIEELRADGYRTKVRKSGNRQVGGVPFSRGMLFQMLTNRIYRGEIVHKGIAHPGEHQPIIDAELWDETERMIERNRVRRADGSNKPHSSLLAGIIFDGHGRRMSPSHTNRSGKRYRYYVTHSSELSSAACPAWRLPAHDAEKVVVDCLKQLLLDRRSISSMVTGAGGGASAARQAIELAADTAGQLETSYGRRTIATNIVTKVEVHDQKVDIAIDRAALLRRLGLVGTADESPLHLTAPAAKVRRGAETRLVLNVEDGSGGGRAELLDLLREALVVRERVLAHPEKTLAELARESSPIGAGPELPIGKDAHATLSSRAVGQGIPATKALVELIARERNFRAASNGANPISVARQERSRDRVDDGALSFCFEGYPRVGRVATRSIARALTWCLVQTVVSGGAIASRP